MEKVILDMFKIYQEIQFLEDKNSDMVFYLINTMVGLFIGVFIVGLVIKFSNKIGIFCMILFFIGMGFLVYSFIATAGYKTEIEEETSLWHKELDSLKNIILEDEEPLKKTVVKKVMESKTVNPKACFTHYKEDQEIQENCFLISVLAEDKTIQNVFIPSSLIESDLT